MNALDVFHYLVNTVIRLRGARIVGPVDDPPGRFVVYVDHIARRLGRFGSESMTHPFRYGHVTQRKKVKLINVNKFNQLNLDQIQR